MRIVSQSGKFDLPYENLVVSISNRDAKKITAWSMSVEADTFAEMGEYSTAEKSNKVMEMLHDAYSKNQFLSRVITGYFSSEIERNEKIECFFNRVRDSFVWQFPQDDEVEV